MKDDADDVVFVDAYNLIYRAFHGNSSDLKTKEGFPTNAIYTVSLMLLKLPQNFSKIKYGMAVFDGGDNFRKEIDENYKANRKEMPENLKVQMPYLKELFELCGWPIYQSKEEEADDVIATLATRSSKKGFNTFIVSSDKDFRQIVTDNVNIIDSMHNICYDRNKVYEKMEVYPENVIGWLALVGDSSDNVKGVDKIGKKSASKLLNEYGSIENLILNKEKIEGKIGENLRKSIEDGQLQKNIELIKIKLDVDIKITNKDVTLKQIDKENLIGFFEKFEMPSLVSIIKNKKFTI